MLEVLEVVLVGVRLVADCQAVALHHIQGNRMSSQCTNCKTPPKEQLPSQICRRRCSR